MRRKFMSILLLTFIFGSCYINAYANFSKQEMSDLIELRDNKLLRYQVAYQTHIHRHEDAQIRKECEYAHDLGQSHKYLHENWIEPDDGINAKYAFSGDIGTTLILDQPDSRGRMWGGMLKTLIFKKIRMERRTHIESTSHLLAKRTKSKSKARSWNSHGMVHSLLMSHQANNLLQ